MRVRKYISLFLFAVTVAGFLPFAIPVSAQGFIPPGLSSFAGIGASVPVANPGELGNRSIVPNFVTLVPGSNLQSTILKTVGTTCTVLDNVDTVLKATSLANTLGGLALITNNTSLMHELTAKITLIQSQITCRVAMQTALNNLDPGSIYFKQDKQSMLASLDTELKRLRDQQAALLVQLRLASAGFWQAVLLSLLKRAGDAMGQALVRKLNHQAASTRFGTDTINLANLAYTGLQLAQATGDKAQQMQIRSLLTNPIISASGIGASAIAQAISFAGDCDRSINVGSNSFYQDMYKCGAMPANPLYNQLAAQDKASFVSTTAKANAASELALGNGYKAGQLCDGGVVQQQQIMDQKYLQAQQKFNDRQTLYQTLQSSGASAADVNQALSDMMQASKDLAKLPDAFGDPAKVACTAIVTPAAMIGDVISHTLNGAVGNLSTFDSHNLPFAVTFMSDMLFNITNKYLFGQDNGAPIASNGQLGQAIGVGLNAVGAQIKNSTDAHSVDPSTYFSGSSSGAGTGTGSPPPANSGGAAPGGNTGSGVTALIQGATRVLGAYDQAEIMPRGPAAVIQPR
jgi:hypothetical protein